MNKSSKDVQSQLKICYFGSYDSKNAPRNQTLIDGLRQNNCDVIEFNLHGNLLRRLIATLINLPKIKCDCIIVGALGNYDVPLAKIVSTVYSAPIIFDIYTPLYETAVVDRKTLDSNSFKAKWFFLVDKISYLLTDLLLLDTKTHIKEFSEMYQVSNRKLKSILVGTDPTSFKPLKKVKKNKKFTVYFHGHFVPLQGTPVIVRAAKRLKNYPIDFVLLGVGQDKLFCKTYKEKYNLKNVKFIPTVSYKSLNRIAQQSHVFLAGPFGSSTKAQAVIPNKVYEAMAMKMPMIVGDTPAIRELLDEQDALLVKPNSATNLAEAILVAHSQYKQMQNKAQRAYKKYLKQATPKKLGYELKLLVEELTGS